MRYASALASTCTSLAAMMLCTACSDAGDTLRNSVSPRSGLTAVSKLAWKESLEVTQPLIRHGRSTYAVRRSSVSEVAADKKLVKTHELDPAPTTQLTVVSKSAYYGAGNTLIATKFPLPTPRWTAELDQEIIAAVTVVSDLVIVPAGALVALDESTGEQRWRFEHSARFEGAVAARDGVVYAAASDGAVVAINVDTGQPDWQTETRSDLQGATPSIADDMLFVAGREGTVWGIFASTGRERWRVATGAEVATNVAAHAGRAWVATSSGEAFAFNTRTGQEVWRMDGLSPLTTTPVWAAGMVYVGGEDGKFLVLGAEDGALKWSHLLDGPPLAPPLVDDGRVWFTDDSGHLYVVE